MATLPVIDVSRPLAEVAPEISRACRELGFFYVVGHGASLPLQARLEQLSRAFFELPIEEKQRIAMSRGGIAWRGWFPLGGELTSGQPDLKEGLYFGQELGADDPRVQSKLPLHGPNLFPELPGFRETVLEYLATMTRVGHRVMEGVALSLGLEASYFAPITRDPTVLFRIFEYPPDALAGAEGRWGVGEHTDYGMLTLLKQDDVGGLQIRASSGWIDAPPIPDGLVCNLGDMLERMTGGLYRSTPHRVRNAANRKRLSFPFFFDPSFDAVVKPIAIPDAERVQGDRVQRWDRASVFDFSGTYGDYLLAKVSKVFPDLGRSLP